MNKIVSEKLAFFTASEFRGCSNSKPYKPLSPKPPNSATPKCRKCRKSENGPESSEKPERQAPERPERPWEALKTLKLDPKTPGVEEYKLHPLTISHFFNCFHYPNAWLKLPKAALILK